MERVLTVTEVNALIKNVIEADRRFSACSISGEISNFKHHSSGHMYFTLKDDQSRIRAIMFAGRNRRLAFRPNDGMRVIVTGSISVFDRDGSYQIYVDDMQPDGVGALYVAFTQLKAKLESEGLFAPSRKRPLPTIPRRIGVVTSPTGAVIRDICSTLKRRFPHATVILSPASVQGPTAAATLVQGLERLVEYSKRVQPVDVVIVARGGGSLEELWPFNEEILARAVALSPIPVVSAVGHETDFTICDFVADVRAATPTAAAELVAPTTQELRVHLRQQATRADVGLSRRLTSVKNKLELLENSRVLKEPARTVRAHRQSVDFLESQLQQHARRPLIRAERQFHLFNERVRNLDIRPRIVQARTKVERMEASISQSLAKRVSRENAAFERIVASLTALNPLAVLSRGYSVVLQENGSVVTRAQELHMGDKVRLKFQDGEQTARIVEDGGDTHGNAVQSRLDI